MEKKNLRILPMPISSVDNLIAGANAVQIGTANFVDPFIWPKVLSGIQDYMQRHDIGRVADLVGTLDTRAQDTEWISS